jgi:hypothetical protein
LRNWKIADRQIVIGANGGNYIPDSLVEKNNEIEVSSDSGGCGTGEDDDTIQKEV